MRLPGNNIIRGKCMEGGGAGADPGFRRGGGGGGGFVHSEGGFRTGISGADPNCCRVLGKSTSKKKLQTAVGGVSDHPKKTPVSAHGGGTDTPHLGCDSAAARLYNDVTMTSSSSCPPHH